MGLAVLSTLMTLDVPRSAAAPLRLTVEPFYLVPSDLQVHPEYQSAISAFMAELTSWYSQRAGRAFDVAETRTVRGPSHDTMRCGAQPDSTCVGDQQAIPRWWEQVQRVVPPSPFTVKVVFSQGGGGFAGANLWGTFTGYAVVGDWVLEPLSGLRDESAIHCGYATWQCVDGTPKGTVAHELGHAFGLHHPPSFESGSLIMRSHWDYPDAGFRPYEIAILKNNPFFAPSRWSDGPWLDYGAQDEAQEGSLLNLPGADLLASDNFYFVHGKGKVRIPASVSPSGAQVVVPTGLGSGMFQVRRGSARGNGVPVNVLPSGSVPAEPVNVSVSALGPDQMRVSWTDASDDESGFRIIDGLSAWTVGADTTEWLLSGLSGGTYKCFKVQSFNSAGASAYVPDSWTCTTTPL